MPTTITRSLLVVIIPGGLALAPWILILVELHDSDFVKLYESHKVLVNACLVGAVIIIGAIGESIMTHKEKEWDKERENKYDVTENWYAYLSHECESEPVAFRYLSGRVTVMYFELTMAPASFSFFIGLSIFLFYQQSGYVNLAGFLHSY